MSSGGAPLRFEVGGLSFSVRCDSAPVVPGDLEPPYDPFLDCLPSAPAGLLAAGADARRPLEVDVRLEPPPDFDEAKLLFTSGEAWTMRAQGDRRIYAHRDPRSDAPQVVMEFPTVPDRVTIWCDPRGWAPDGESDGVRTPLRYPLDQILLLYVLPAAGGLLVHSTGVVLGGRAFVCCGVSGAGKSTLARQMMAAGMKDLLSDDRIILRRLAAGWTAFGTPWAGDARVAVNESAPLRALLFLRQSDENRITALQTGEALHRLLKVTSIPWFDPGVMTTALDVCDDLVTGVPAYELAFRPEPAAARMVSDFAASAFED